MSLRTFSLLSPTQSSHSTSSSSMLWSFPRSLLWLCSLSSLSELYRKGGKTLGASRSAFVNEFEGLRLYDWTWAYTRLFSLETHFDLAGRNLESIKLLKGALKVVNANSCQRQSVLGYLALPRCGVMDLYGSCFASGFVVPRWGCHCHVVDASTLPRSFHLSRATEPTFR